MKEYLKSPEVLRLPNGIHFGESNDYTPVLFFFSTFSVSSYRLNTKLLVKLTKRNGLDKSVTKEI